MCITILYSFCFDNKIIFEIRDNNAPINASKEEKYYWFIHENNINTRMKIDRVEDGIRYFQDGSVLDLRRNMFNDIKINNYDKNVLYKFLESRYMVDISAIGC